ncbi:MAG: AAA family ATPase [Candidatus Binataceae bacterium]
MASQTNGTPPPLPKDYSPFTPGVPVPVEFFVGRLSEITLLKIKVLRSVIGGPQVAYVSGERGIGKTSLAAFVRRLVERDGQVLGIHVFLGGVPSLEECVRLIFDRLVKESFDKPWYQKIKDFLGTHIQQVGLFGVSVGFQASATDLQRLSQDFAPSLSALIEKLGDEKKAILLILDDINGLANLEEFANWLKSLIDEMATSHKRFPVCLMLVGLEERRQALVSLQPSLSRVFELVDIKAWDREETAQFYRDTFGKVGAHVEEKALDFLGELSGGLPVLAHEIGDAVFKVDNDGKIDTSDAVEGVIQAAEIVGRKYLEPQIFHAIRSTHYRSILSKLAVAPPESGLLMRFKRRDLLSSSSTDEKRVLDNFLRRMKELGVIRNEQDGGPGAYTFCNRLHYLYFRINAQEARRCAKS